MHPIDHCMTFAL